MSALASCAPGSNNSASGAAVVGCLIGCAIGDSVALPYEGLSRRRVRRIVQVPVRHRLLFGHGMVSDDTDHTIFVAQALLCSDGNVQRFQQSLSWRLRLWLATLPAGIGLATLRAIALLWLGVPPDRSGVNSAGNGPSMRSAIIGCHFHGDSERRRRHVEVSTRMTHTDPIALAGALAIAEVAARLAGGQWTERPMLDDFAATLRSVSADPNWQAVVTTIVTSCAGPQPLDSAAKEFGQQGISGYTLHSVPFALVAWYAYFGDFRACIEGIILAGGDTDTVAAIAGALAGISSGIQGIPADWLEGLADWPHGARMLCQLGDALARGDRDGPTTFRPGLFLRSPFFLLVVLIHGMRRMLPPY